MQQQQPQQQPGGSQFGAPPPEMAPFPSSSAGARAHMLGTPGGGADALHTPPHLSSQLAEAASPISSRPPPPLGGPGANFDELAPSMAGGFPDDEALAAGEDAERGGMSGNRWPRQETLALLKIRSEMDAAFREATFKGPLWEEVSRKLVELGYKRSAKKCKEKFENVHKYYKRTKEGRAGRQDGKTYRFFSQLEALHNSGHGRAATPTAAASPTPISFNTAMASPPATRIQPSSLPAATPQPVSTPTRVVPELGPQGMSNSAATAPAATAGFSFSWNSSSTSSAESDDEDTVEAGGSRDGRKRKRSGGSRSRRQMMSFFEGLMNQVMERQEAMQQRFLEAIEKREQDRMIREEAWRRQEMARLNREQELLAHERAMAASRDTAVISYLQKISGHSIPLPTMPSTTTAVAAVSIATPPPQPSLTLPPPPPQPAAQPQLVQTPPKQKPPVPATPLQQKHEAPQLHTQSTNVPQQRPSSSVPTQLVPIGSEPQESLGSGGSFEPASSSRWPKGEVHALIKLRSGLELRYQEVGPKGPLWEEISAGMQRLGYNRSSKRCKEKWENINKYFKKVKDSNKQRPEDSKTCPYFHQLDALYRKKLGGGGGGSSNSNMAAAQQQHEQDTSCSPASQERAADTMAPLQQLPGEGEGKNNDIQGNNRNGGNSEAGGGGSLDAQVQTNNVGHAPSLFEEGMKKSENIVKDLMEPQRQQQSSMMDDDDKMDEPDSDNLDQDDGDDDEDDEDSKMQYKIQFQRQSTVSGSGGNNPSTPGAAAATTTPSSFLAMVQ